MLRRINRALFSNKKKGNKLAQAGRLPDGKGYFNQSRDVVSIMIDTLLGKKGSYLYTGLSKRKTGTAAADTKGRTDIIMFMSLVCSLGNRLLRA
jgi:hypothetical protein